MLEVFFFFFYFRFAQHFASKSSPFHQIKLSLLFFSLTRFSHSQARALYFSLKFAQQLRRSNTVIVDVDYSVNHKPGGWYWCLAGDSGAKP